MFKQLLYKHQLKTQTTSHTFFLLLFGLIPYATSAFATLGGDSASVESDRVNMKVARMARQTLSTSGSYTIHEMTISTGTIVRQYVSNNNVVFGVAWS